MSAHPELLVLANHVDPKLVFEQMDVDKDGCVTIDEWLDTLHANTKVTMSATDLVS